MNTEKHYFCYGSQAYEFERPSVSDAIKKQGLTADIKPTKTALQLRETTSKAVITNDPDKAK